MFGGALKPLRQACQRSRQRSDLSVRTWGNAPTWLVQMLPVSLSQTQTRGS